MKGLKKLALAAAVVAPFAHAEMTSIDDSMMSEMTGQAGITIDIDLAMTIGEVRYIDQDGFGADGLDQGYLTFSNVQVGELGTGSLTAAQIRGVTIDVDNAQGIVIGLGQIGSGTDMAGLTAGHFWNGLDVRADFGINGVEAGSFAIDNITNFVPNALVLEGVTKFGINTNVTGTNVVPDTTTLVTNFSNSLTSYFVTNGIAAPTDADVAAAKTSAVGANAAALLDGSFIDAWVAINAGGSDDGDASGTAQGLTISASTGFVIEKMAYVDDGREMGIHNFTMFDVDGAGNIIGFQVNGLTIDVVAHAAAASGAALKIGGATMTGTIAMGDIYIGNHVNGSLGALAIKNINMSATDIYVYGH